MTDLTKNFHVSASRSFGRVTRYVVICNFSKRRVIFNKSMKYGAFQEKYNFAFSECVNMTKKAPSALVVVFLAGRKERRKCINFASQPEREAFCRIVHAMIFCGDEVVNAFNEHSRKSTNRSATREDSFVSFLLSYSAHSESGKPGDAGDGQRPATSNSGSFQLIPGESAPVAESMHVSRSDEGFRSNGALYLTCFRLVYKAYGDRFTTRRNTTAHHKPSSESKNRRGGGSRDRAELLPTIPDRGLCQVDLAADGSVNLPLTSVTHIERKSKTKVTIHCKDLHQVSFNFDQMPQWVDGFVKLFKDLQYPRKYSDLFAFRHCRAIDELAGQQDAEQFDGWELYNIDAEMQRLGVMKQTGFARVGGVYYRGVCPESKENLKKTPAKLKTGSKSVPASAAHFSRQLAHIHACSSAELAVCVEGKDGGIKPEGKSLKVPRPTHIRNSSVSSVRQLSGSIGGGGGGGGDKSEHSLGYAGNADEVFDLCPTYPPCIYVPMNITMDKLKQVAAYRSKGRVPAVVWRHAFTGATLTRCAQPLPGALGRKNERDVEYLDALRQLNPTNDSILYIIDARPKAAAIGNSLMGKGYELASHYPQTQLSFEGIDNIHAVRSAHQKLAAVCASMEFVTEAGSNSAAPIENRTQITNSDSQEGWMGRVERSGWPSLVRLVVKSAAKMARMLEDEGASVLVHCSDGWDRTSQLSALTQLLLDPYYRTCSGMAILIEKEWCSFGHKFEERYGHGMSNYEHQQRSPIFLHFLSCVYQLLVQFPAAFEFNADFLLAIMDQSSACRFGTFMRDCYRERRAPLVGDGTLSVRAHTVSLWTYLLSPSRLHHFVNPFYRPYAHRRLVPDTSFSSYRLWDHFFLRQNPSFARSQHAYRHTPLCLPRPPAVTLQGLRAGQLNGNTSVDDGSAPTVFPSPNALIPPYFPSIPCLDSAGFMRKQHLKLASMYMALRAAAKEKGVDVAGVENACMSGNNYVSVLERAIAGQEGSSAYLYPWSARMGGPCLLPAMTERLGLPKQYGGAVSIPCGVRDETRLHRTSSMQACGVVDWTAARSLMAGDVAVPGHGEGGDGGSTAGGGSRSLSPQHSSSAPSAGLSMRVGRSESIVLSEGEAGSDLEGDESSSGDDIGLDSTAGARGQESMRVVRSDMSSVHQELLKAAASRGGSRRGAMVGKEFRYISVSGGDDSKQQSGRSHSPATSKAGDSPSKHSSKHSSPKKTSSPKKSAPQQSGTLTNKIGGGIGGIGGVGGIGGIGGVGGGESDEDSA